MGPDVKGGRKRVGLPPRRAAMQNLAAEESQQTRSRACSRIRGSSIAHRPRRVLIAIAFAPLYRFGRAARRSPGLVRDSAPDEHPVNVEAARPGCQERTVCTPRCCGRSERAVQAIARIVPGRANCRVLEKPLDDRGLWWSRHFDGGVVDRKELLTSDSEVPRGLPRRRSNPPPTPSALRCPIPHHHW
jgi:hypothetical protein